VKAPGLYTHETTSHVNSSSQPCVLWRMLIEHLLNTLEALGFLAAPQSGADRRLTTIFQSALLPFSADERGAGGLAL